MNPANTLSTLNKHKQEILMATPINSHTTQ